MDRRCFLKTMGLSMTALLLGGCSQFSTSRHSRKRPNLIIITTHDTGCHLGCYGVPTVHTPNIDRLADEGVLFTRMFSPEPMCSPSRGSLLTGQWPQRNGLYGLAGNGWDYTLNDIHMHLSHVLRDAGYHTALFGHQHENHDEEKLGFNSIYKTHGPRARRGADQICGAAAEFITSEAAAHQPFYLQIGFHETHTPYLWSGLEPDDCPEPWVPPYAEPSGEMEGLKEHLREFQASIHRVDRGVGLVLDALKTSGLENDTMILFNTEHGPELPRAKWTMLEAGTHVAFILRWPGGGICGGQRCDAILSNVDFLPTFSQMTGVQIPHEMDGVSFADVIGPRNKKSTRKHVYGFYVYGQQCYVRGERYKLIRNFLENGYNAEKFRQNSKVPLVQLFDLQNDPLETKNLADEPKLKQVRDQLDSLLWRHLEDVDSPLLKGLIEHPFIKWLRDDYARRKGQWGEDISVLTETSRTPDSKTMVSTADYKFQVDWKQIWRDSAIQLYDLKNDPQCKTNLAQKDEYQQALSDMKALMFTWLEKEDAPILEGPCDVPVGFTRMLADYENWKNLKS